MCDVQDTEPEFACVYLLEVTKTHICSRSISEFRHQILMFKDQDLSAAKDSQSFKVLHGPSDLS